MEDDTCQCKQESKEMHLMWVYLQSVLWICHISNFSMLATTQHVLHLCECAADVTSSLLSSIWCRSSGKTHTWKWQLNATLFPGKKDSTWRLETTEMKHLIFHVVVVFLCFFVSPFDLICSFGLVGAEQLIQQTWLRRCEVCTQT